MILRGETGFVDEEAGGWGDGVGAEAGGAGGATVSCSPDVPRGAEVECPPKLAQNKITSAKITTAPIISNLCFLKNSIICLILTDFNQIFKEKGACPQAVPFCSGRYTPQKLNRAASSRSSGEDASSASKGPKS